MRKLIILAALIILSAACILPANAKTDLMSYFAGNWITFNQYGQKKVTLKANGEYVDYSESTHSGSTYNQYGDQTGAWGTGSQSENHMRWSAQGTKERGQFIFTYEDGSQDVVEYHVHVEKGKTYWNEYIVDGKIYSRQ